MAGAALWAPLCVVALLVVPSSQQYPSTTPCRDAKHQQGPVMPGSRHHDCDTDGTYKPQQCIGSRCFCVDRHGEQLKQFDTVGRHEAHLVSCACARQTSERDDRRVGRSVACDRRGNFEPRQCIGSTCHCVDRRTGERQDGVEPVHVGQIGQLDCGAEPQGSGQRRYQGPEVTADEHRLGGDTPCWDEVRQQEQRGAGSLLGAARPDCDRRGRYQPKQCRGSKCYCVAPDGRRLEQYQMAPRERPIFCACARRAHEIAQSGLVGVIVACDDHGDYEAKQCVGSVCHCASPVTGEKHRGSAEVAIHQLGTLDCSADGSGQERQAPLGSRTPCWDELKQHEQSGRPLLGAEKPNCDRTGRYHPKQCKGSECFCVDPHNVRLEPYRQPRHLSADMGCVCSRREWELQQGRLLGLSVNCDPLGNFSPQQCTGSQCHCVEPLTGQKIAGLEAHVANLAQLDCTSHRRQLRGGDRPCDDQRRRLRPGQPAPECDRAGKFAPIQCSGELCRCVGPNGEKLEGYNQPLRYRERMSCVCARQAFEANQDRLGRPVTCDKFGGFHTRQCEGSTCYCVDPASGQPQGGATVHISQLAGLDCGGDQRPALGSQQPCWQQRRQLEQKQRQAQQPLLGLELPRCDRSGRFEPKQCRGSGCYCVDPEGNHLSGYSGARHQEQDMHCVCARMKHESSALGLIGTSHNCDTLGNFEERQCLGSRCFCVDTYTGGQVSEGSVFIAQLATLDCRGSGTPATGGRPLLGGGRPLLGGDGSGVRVRPGQGGGGTRQLLGGSGYSGGTSQHGGSGHSGGTSHHGGSGHSGGTSQHGGSGHSGGTSHHGGSGHSAGTSHHGGSGHSGGTSHHGGSGHSGGTSHHGGSGHSGGSRPLLGGGARVRPGQGGAGLPPVYQRPLGTNTPCWEERSRVMQHMDHGQSGDGATLPDCDRTGRYMPKQCRGSQCRCVDPDGNTIENFVKNIWDGPDMNCQCARRRYEISVGNLLGTSLVCNDLGNFEKHQCTGSQCICVDRLTGEQVPGTQSVHVSELSRLEETCPRQGASHPCWDERQRIKEQSGGRLLPGASLPECDLFGQYKARQCRGSQCFCVGPANEQMEGYLVPIGRSAEMHCKCARREWQLRKQRLLGQSVRCDELGNFHPQQCTGSSCYRVDTKTGRRVQQSQQQRQQTARPCDEVARRQTGGSWRPTCERDGTFAARQCRGDTCRCMDPAGNQLRYRSQQHENAACHCARREHELNTNGLVGVIVRCDERGDYHPVQCHGSQCHCVDPVTGHRRPGSPSQHVTNVEKLNCGAAESAQRVQPVHYK